MSNASTSNGTCAPATAPTLAVVTAVPGMRDGDQLILDRKAMEGIEYRAAHWPGRVCWLLSFVDRAVSYSERYDPASLPFDVIEVAADRSDVAAKLPDDAIVEASADIVSDLRLAEAMPGRVIYILEYTLKTRLDIQRVADIPFYLRLRRMLWELSMEPRRKRAIRASAGLLCNGLPAYNRYASIAPSAMQFFDTRLTDAMQIDADALARKQDGIRQGDPLRLAFSGRLDRMKGAQFLLPVMRRLKAAGVDFVFEVFGAGELACEFEAAASGELASLLHYPGPVPFAEELVPTMRARVDLFVCPHPQGDPSCTYLETLGCGVPIVGFANEAWATTVEGQSFGEAVPVGDVAALADAIIRLDKDRERLAAMAGEAASFSAPRTFEHVFAARLDYVRDVAKARSA